MLESSVESVRASSIPDSSSRPKVMPLARALDVLGAYTPGDRWLGNAELAVRTGLPASTVARLAQSLTQLGYLHQTRTTANTDLHPRSFPSGTRLLQILEHISRLGEACRYLQICTKWMSPSGRVTGWN